MGKIKDEFFENHNADVSFFYTGKSNIVGGAYADAVIANTRNAHYINIASITFDTTLQSSEEFVINELFSLKIENNVAAQYSVNSVKVAVNGHMVGKRINKNKFKCIILPDIEYLTIPEIYITEESYLLEGRTEYKIKVWLHTENVKRIYTSKISSNSRNSSPLNTEFLDSRYYFDLLTNEDMVYDVDTTNIFANISSKQFSSGVSIYYPIDNRMKKLEAIKYPDFKFGTVNYDLSWVPESEGAASTGYQRITPVTVDYGASVSPAFLKVQTGAVKGVSVNEDGLYQLQIVSGFNTISAMKDSDIELSLFKNNDILNSTSLVYKLKADEGKTNYANPIGISAPFIVVRLTTTDIVRIQFKFLGTPQNGVINKGTKLQVFKVLQIP